MLLEHLADGDLDALMALYEDDAVSVGPDGGQAVGRAAVREALAVLPAVVDRFSLEPTFAVRRYRPPAGAWTLDGTAPTPPDRCPG
ncbi:YybH family protein [Streptomyces sp. NPDC051636]|uniref:YybH family protein n=1 Tax=Streptomyces sp. NPDC051636 TaxID=3365663 RepID=UPI0037902343